MKTQVSLSGAVQTFCRAELNSRVKFDKSTEYAQRLNQTLHLSSFNILLWQPPGGGGGGGYSHRFRIGMCREGS